MAKKGKYDDLDEEFKAKIAGSAQDDKTINDAIREASLYMTSLSEKQLADEDLKAKKEIASDAGAVYRDGKKICLLKIAYCRDILKNRARVLPGD